MLVVDASAILELVLNTPLSAAVANRIIDDTLLAPELIGLEVVSVINRLANTDRLAEHDARTALDVFRTLGVETYPHDELLVRIHELRANLTAYDAAYIALAEATGAALLTCDRKLARSPGHRATCALIT